MSNKSEKIEALYIEGFQQLHAEGQEWIYAPDLAQRTASLDEKYVARREALVKVLGFMGIDRPLVPYFPRSGSLYVIIDRLERDGSIEGMFSGGRISSETGL